MGKKLQQKIYRENKALEEENEEKNSDQSSESSDGVEEVFQVVPPNPFYNKKWYQQIPCKNNGLKYTKIKNAQKITKISKPMMPTDLPLGALGSHTQGAPPMANHLRL